MDECQHLNIEMCEHFDRYYCEDCLEWQSEACTCGPDPVPVTEYRDGAVIELPPEKCPYWREHPPLNAECCCD